METIWFKLVQSVQVSGLLEAHVPEGCESSQSSDLARHPFGKEERDAPSQTITNSTQRIALCHSDEPKQLRNRKKRNDEKSLRLIFVCFYLTIYSFVWKSAVKTVVTRMVLEIKILISGTKMLH
ncbi:hypothetical protein AVEN_217899-1 [Araneus ventricosus]|uniref:Uncharacterized protein n=1 Tax=Araneus ventricosus TaxID=182803 RepID=A0A4Y2EIB9_ARAVE|nr:hypothetical protein AVEN_217899-1 [Araneus ventricosus]